MATIPRRPVVAGVTLLTAAGLVAGGCGSSGTSSVSTQSCTSRSAPAVNAAGSPATGPASANKPAPGWSLPGGDLQNTRDVQSAITSSNLSQLGVAWTVPLNINTTHTDGAYATTPVVVNGVVYVQDLESDVLAISLATGKVLWTHDYNSPNGGPDGVNVVNGTVYAATNHAAFALDAATGRQLWIRTLTANLHEGIDMTPGYNRGTVYVSTVPVNASTGVVYGGGGKATLWALNAATGAPEWSWDEVQDLWGNPGINSGGGQWYAPSFDAQGDIYIGVANPGPLGGVKGYPWGTSRPGPDLYTDSVVKLSPSGTLLSNGSTAFAAVNDLAMLVNATGYTGSVAADIQAILNATGEMVAVSQDTGKIEWDTRLPSTPYGAAAVTNDVVFTTTFHGDLYALNAATGAILLKTPLSAGTNAPVAIDGDYVIAGAGTSLAGTQQPLIIAYKLGAHGKLPDTVSP